MPIHSPITAIVLQTIRGNDSVVIKDIPQTQSCGPIDVNPHLSGHYLKNHPKAEEFPPLEQNCDCPDGCKYSESIPNRHQTH